MSKDQLTFQNLLTWDDVIQLGDPKGYTSIHIGNRFLTSCCSKNYHKRLFLDNVQELFVKPFLNKIPDFPFSMEEFDFRICLIKNSVGKWELKISKPYFISFLLEQGLGDLFIQSNKQRLISFLAYTKQDLLLVSKNFLREAKVNLDKLINKCHSLSPERYELIERRNKINWCIRNLDRIFSFLDDNINLEILESVDKDIFLLQMVSSAFANTNISKFYNGDISIEQVLAPLVEKGELISFDYLNNYRLMVQYLEQENGETYSANISCDLKSGNNFIVTSNTFLDQLEKFESVLQQTELAELYHSRKGRFSTYEELLAEKAYDTWKRLQNDKLIKSIQVSWEMIPAGENTSLHNYRNNSGNKVVFPSNKSQADMKKAYDLVEEKNKYFYNSNPVCELKGINTFEGYSAYMYSNGVVVFEKFYKPKTVRVVNPDGKKSKEVIMVPVDGEAIYVMNFRNFADYSKYSKPVLIEESCHNSDIRRINHTQNGSWKEKLDSIINGPGCGKLDLEQVDELAKQLAKRTRV